ncbi:cytochrome c [Gluconobacter wancherniae]|nr:cytochrome c [Gluconobacter wancherniae]
MTWRGLMRLPSLLPVLAATMCAMPVSAAYAQDDDLIKQGAYVAILGDCVACHTAHNGQAMAGGLSLQSPIGAIYSTNITPDHETGIGEWSFEDFARLMRRGIKKNGSSVYPAMPYPSYSSMTDQDLQALYAYLMGGVKPVKRQNRPTDIAWPMSMRWPLSLWRMVFAGKPIPEVASYEQNSLVARGRYLVEGLGHCGSCHTPRNFAFAEKARTATEGRQYLSGGFVVDNWVAPSLRSDDVGGLSDWTVKDIVAFLKTGRNMKGATFGAMNSVVVHSTSVTNDHDLVAIATFLKTLGTSERAPAIHYRYDDMVSKQLYAGRTSSEGARIYIDRCAACHRTNGHGYPNVFPPLAGNPVLQESDATSIAHIILNGGKLPGVNAAPSLLVMAPYRDILSDKQVADVVTFIGRSWGNRGAEMTEAQVAQIRHATKGEEIPAGE